MIPKKIHYVWVGDKPKPELVLHCMESWKKYCPDYEIKEWNNESLKKIDNLYVSQAFEYKKWAFVSDYLRLYALFNEGGFYFDTDLEVTQNLEPFRHLQFVSGYENYEGNISPVTALMGAEPKQKIIKDLLDEYDDLSFIHNGKLDQTPNTTRISRYFSKNFNLNKPYNGSKKSILTQGCEIYPSYFFCTPEKEKENYAIHHFSGSWIDPYARKNLFMLGGYKFVRFKKRSKISGTTLPLLKNETVIKEWNISQNKKVCLIKEQKA